ncbi:MAG: alpha/beta hydrolase [Anaerolineae bacterium]|nr:MAG: alpha/beta hydrolase [Anaerolineae bacterium]
MNLLDNPFVLSILFHPRTDQPRYLEVAGKVQDGMIPVENDVVLGYRLYVHEPGKPVLLYFHGNGEIASDHDGIASLYHGIGASLLVVDYRGYGWSTGKPLVSTLLSDTEAVYNTLPDILKKANLSTSPLFIMGRSLGSLCAIHVAHQHPDFFKGLIVESGLAHILPLLARLGLSPHLLGSIPDPIGNVSKMQKITLPLLVIHGEQDSLVPVANGQALYDASPAERKTILRIPGAEHNDLMFVGLHQYMGAIQKFMDQ